MKDFCLDAEELQALKLVHRATKEKWAADRLKAIILLAKGWTDEQVAEALLLDPQTIRNYLKIFKEGGAKALTDRHYKGSASKLTSDQQGELKEHLAKVTYPTVSAIVAYVQHTYGVSYAISGMTKLLHQLGFVHKKPDLAPCRVDAVKQLEFLQTYEEIRRSGKPVYSLDGCHPQHNSMPQYGWILKGHSKMLPSNTGRKRVNLQGAVNLDTHELVSTVHETLDRHSTIDLLKMLEKKHKQDDVVYVIVDNAGYYHAKEVKDYLKHSNIKLVFLPPYAPHLSLVERVWRYFKKEVLYNRYYPTFGEFKEAVLNFLKRSHQSAFKTLLTEKFHFSRPRSTMMQLPAPT